MNFAEEKINILDYFTVTVNVILSLSAKNSSQSFGKSENFRKLCSEIK